jgi:hypothetical protein
MLDLGIDPFLGLFIPFWIVASILPEGGWNCKKLRFLHEKHRAGPALEVCGKLFQTLG